MELISGLALVLLTLVGYSSGSVLGAKGRTPVPGVLDLAVVVVLWVCALSTRATLGKWAAIGVWLVAGLIISGLLAMIRAGSYTRVKRSRPAGNLWQAWKDFAGRMGNYQSRILMAFLYFTIVLPFALGVTLFGDPLRIKYSTNGSNWQSKQLPAKPTLYEAGRQF